MYLPFNCCRNQGKHCSLKFFELGRVLNSYFVVLIKIIKIFICIQILTISANLALYSGKWQGYKFFTSLLINRNSSENCALWKVLWKRYLVDFQKVWCDCYIRTYQTHFVAICLHYSLAKIFPQPNLTQKKHNLAHWFLCIIPCLWWISPLFSASSLQGNVSNATTIVIGSVLCRKAPLLHTYYSH